MAILPPISKSARNHKHLETGQVHGYSFDSNILGLSGKVHSGQVVGGSKCHFILLVVLEYGIDLVAWVVPICTQNFYNL